MVLPLEQLTVGQLLHRTARRFPEREALVYGEERWTYQEMDDEVDHLARRLLAWGVKRGDHVGVWCEAEPDTILLMYALPRIGAVAALLNTGLQRSELADLLRRSDVSRLLISDGYKQLNFPALCQGLREELDALQAIAYVGRSGDSNGFPTLRQMPEAEADQLAAAEAAVQPEDTAFILYTSGTTSLSKAVLSSQYSRANNGIQQAHDLGATEQDRICAALPTFHCFCLSVNIMAACASGACLVLPPSRHTAAILETISKERCTILSAVPTLFHAMLCRPDFREWDLSSLRTGFIGGSTYPTALFEQIEHDFGYTLLSSLGLTETTAGITTAWLDDPLNVRATTVGHFMDHIEGKIVDPHTGKTQPTGEAGEICVRGYMVMQGYYGQPEETAKVIDTDGWCHTGDLGWMDAEGNVHLAGRIKELIIRGGENISPVEIEAVLFGDSRIRECKAVGVPDRHYGEEVCLCIVPNGEAPAEYELRALLSSRLAFYKVPKYILMMEELPKTTSGKIQSNAVAACAIERLGLR